MDRQTLRDWVPRYNANEPKGLFNQPPRLSAEQLARIAAWVEQHGVVRLRCVDLQTRIRREFSVELHDSTVGKLLHKLSPGTCRCVHSIRCVVQWNVNANRPPGHCRATAHIPDKTTARFTSVAIG